MSNAIVEFLDLRATVTDWALRKEQVIEQKSIYSGTTYNDGFGDAMWMVVNEIERQVRRLREDHNDGK